MDFIISFFITGIVILSYQEQVVSSVCWESKGAHKVTKSSMVIDLYGETSATDCIPHCESDPWCLGFHYESTADTCYLANSAVFTAFFCLTCEFFESTCKGATEYADPKRISVDPDCYFISHGTLKKSSTPVVSSHILGNSAECRNLCDNTTGCRGANYRTTTQTCELYDEVVVTVQVCVTCILMEKICLTESSSILIESTALVPSTEMVSSTSPSVVASAYITVEPTEVTSLQLSSSLVLTTSFTLHETSVLSSMDSSVHSSQYDTPITSSVTEQLESSLYLSTSTINGASSSYIVPSEVTLESTTYSIQETTTYSPSPQSQTGTNNACSCNCTTTVTTEDLQKQLKHLRQILSLNKTKLSATLRRKYSVYDGRTSSQIIGYTGGIIIGLVIVVVSGSDVLNACKFLMSHARSKA